MLWVSIQYDVLFSFVNDVLIDHISIGNVHMMFVELVIPVFGD